MKPLYEGNDIYTFSLTTGKEVTLTISEIQEISLSSEQHTDLDFKYNELVDREKTILSSIEKGLEVLTEMENKINTIKRRKLKDELLSLHQEIDDLIGQCQWI